MASRPMRDLVAGFGGSFPDGPGEDLPAWLDDFSSRHWDFRQGAEPHRARPPDPPAGLNALVESADTVLGPGDGSPHRLGPIATWSYWVDSREAARSGSGPWSV